MRMGSRRRVAKPACATLSRSKLEVAVAVVAPSADMKNIVHFVSQLERLLPEPSAFSRSHMTSVRQ